MIELMTATLVFVVGLTISLACAKYLRITPFNSIVLYVWHTALCLVYVYISLQDIADSTWYFETSLTESVPPLPGTDFVVWITRIFSVHLGLDYLATNLAFNVFGAIGLLFLYDAIRHVSSAHRVARSIGILVTFLPSLSFWSCAIGKDSVAFLGVVLALRASLYVPYRIWMFVLGATILVMVRPHVATLMAFVGMMALAFQGRKIRWRRLPVVVAGMILSFGIAIWTLQSYVGIETQDSIAEYVDGRQMLELGSASVDLTSMSVPMRLFTYMFRPLLWEASSLMQVLAAIENIIILAIFAIGVYQLNRFGTRLLPQQWIFMIGPDYQ